MARKTKAAPSGAELATVDGGDALAELADFFDDVDVTGLEDFGGEDIVLAAKIFNMGGLDEDGRAYPRDTFFDTITTKTQDELRAVLLVDKKSHRWDEYNNAEERTDVLCQSDDRVSGIMHDGTERACASCPDYQWRRGDDGKPVRRCGPVHTVVGIELENETPFLIRFKKTGLKAWRAYTMAHHKGKYKSRKTGKRGDVPLFAYECNLSLRMHSGGKYALPILEKGATLSRDAFEDAHEAAKAYLDIINKVVAVADAQDARHAAPDKDPALGSDDFADDDFAGG